MTKAILNQNNLKNKTMDDIKFEAINFGYNSETINILEPFPPDLTIEKALSDGKNAMSNISRKDIESLKKSRISFVWMYCTSVAQLGQSILLDKLYYPHAYIFPYQETNLSILLGNYRQGFEIITPNKAKKGRIIKVKPMNFKIDFKKGIQYNVLPAQTTSFIFQTTKEK